MGFLGSKIRIETDWSNGISTTTIFYKDRVVGGIQRLNMQVEANPFGEKIEVVEVEMFDPNDMYFNNPEYRGFVEEFMSELKDRGGRIKIKSFYDIPAPSTVANELSDFGKLAAACLSIAGIATLLSGSKKKGVHKKATETNVSRK